MGPAVDEHGLDPVRLLGSAEEVRRPRVEHFEHLITLFGSPRFVPGVTNRVGQDFSDVGLVIEEQDGRHREQRLGCRWLTSECLEDVEEFGKGLVYAGRIFEDEAGCSEAQDGKAHSHPMVFVGVQLGGEDL